MGRIIFTDNGYGYEKEGLEKSEIADGVLVTDDGIEKQSCRAEITVSEMKWIYLADSDAE